MTNRPRSHRSDKEYLRGFSTPFLKGLHDRTVRSKDELTEYLATIDDVLAERADANNDPR